MPLFPRSILTAATLLTATFAISCQSSGQGGQKPVGYADTPKLPNSEYRVHGVRPEPKVVEPGTESTAKKAGTAPSDAVVLFDGKDLSEWVGNKDDAAWKVSDGHMEVNGTGDIRTRREFGDCQLHIEWASPAEVKGESQGRGNSGVFLMGRYEVQILDSHQNRTYPDGQASALYGQYPPMVNASRPAGEWQSYDIIFEAPRFDGEKLVKPAYVTVMHNGVIVYHRRKLIGSTTHRQVASYAPHAETGPIKLQDHGNPVRFRNVWVRPLKFED